MAGASARDYGGGFNTKGWQSAGSGTFHIATGTGFDEEAAKQVKPEKSVQDERDEEKQRFRQQHQQDGKEFEAAKSEHPATATSSKRLPVVSTSAASSALKKRELPKILQIRKKDAAADGVPAAAAEAEESPAKRSRAEADAIGAAAAPLAASAGSEPAPSASGCGLLAGYGSDSSSEEEKQ